MEFIWFLIICLGVACHIGIGIFVAKKFDMYTSAFESEGIIDFLQNIPWPLITIIFWPVVLGVYALVVILILFLKILASSDGPEDYSIRR